MGTGCSRNRNRDSKPYELGAMGQRFFLHIMDFNLGSVVRNLNAQAQMPPRSSGVYSRTGQKFSLRGVPCPTRENVSAKINLRGCFRIVLPCYSKDAPEIYSVPPCVVC